MIDRSRVLNVECPRCKAPIGSPCKNCHELCVHIERLKLCEAWERVPELTEAVRICDDRLGSYSDHEGDQNGPTFYLWKQGPELFAAHVERAIADHQEAIRIWRKFGAVNKIRMKAVKK